VAPVLRPVNEGFFHRITAGAGQRPGENAQHLLAWLPGSPGSAFGKFMDGGAAWLPAARQCVWRGGKRLRIYRADIRE